MRVDWSLKKLEYPLNYIQKRIITSQNSVVKFIKISPKNAKIAVLEQLEPKIFLATQPWWVAFKEPVEYKNVWMTKFSQFLPLEQYA